MMHYIKFVADNYCYDEKGEKKCFHRTNASGMT